ncbi:hypothetical protein Taro_016914 [Colocasia esculenta]|uniref:Homeobox domain-containing protein n=1 Tax=Colocasia esculenta TaxID=4460 RepID=A0A843URR6_COLES|nr:hypothetical protein [Colocasia esculenta]
MKLVQQSTPAFLDCEPSLPSLGFKRLRPLVPRTAGAAVVDAAAASKSFTKHVQHVQWKPNSTFPVAGRNPTRLESQQQQSGGGTRWNPTPEQIQALEALYRGGMRTPNARQIEQITAELGKFGKIEGKNVFYWFQNHKARERQKQKRDALALGLGAGGGSTASSADSTGREVRRDYVGSSCKRRCKSWSAGLEEFDGGGGGGGGERTLKLFPLHPEGI